MPALGWIPDTPDARDWTLAHPMVRPLLRTPTFRAVQTERPSRVLWPQFSPQIRDQGQLGSCVAFGATRVVEFLEQKAKGRYQPKSPLFTYWNGRDDAGLLPQGDTGLTIRDAIRSLAIYGACPEAAWPYKPARFQEQPPLKAFLQALNHQIIHYLRLTTLEQIKAFLRLGQPVIFGFFCFASIEQVGQDGWIPLPRPRERFLGGHCVVAEGYDDECTPPAGCPDPPGALRIANSWGPHWGDRGYGWLPYGYFWHTPSLALDPWVVLHVELPRLIQEFS